MKWLKGQRRNEEKSQGERAEIKGRQEMAWGEVAEKKGKEERDQRRLPGEGR